MAIDFLVAYLQVEVICRNDIVMANGVSCRIRITAVWVIYLIGLYAHLNSVVMSRMHSIARTRIIMLAHIPACQHTHKSQL